MVNYRRNYVAGGTYFFTVTLRDRRSSVLVDYIGELRQAFAVMQAKKPAVINAIVILPEHLHTVMTLPDQDSDYPDRWRIVKSAFTRSLKKQGVVLGKDRRGEYNLWQKRYWEHTIRDEDDYRYHIDYVHYNPVKHGLVEQVKDWPHSSFHQYVKCGLYTENWGV